MDQPKHIIIPEDIDVFTTIYHYYYHQSIVYELEQKVEKLEKELASIHTNQLMEKLDEVLENDAAYAKKENG